MHSKSSSSELILNPDGTIYHLNLRQEQVAKTIILVGDPGRVARVSKHFDHIEFRVEKREFITHTGTLDGKRLTVISTGIGTDNIDIVMNELDALFNVDMVTRQPKGKIIPLHFIRIGTSGCLQPDIPVDSMLASGYGFGLDGLLHFYGLKQEQGPVKEAIWSFLESEQLKLPISPYLGACSSPLLNNLNSDFITGITITCPGFYGPQGRSIRLKAWDANFLDKLARFRKNGLRMTNFEMETAAIYALANAMGHQAISFNALIANRANNTFSTQAQKTVNRLIEEVLTLINNSILG